MTVLSKKRYTNETELNHLIKNIPYGQFQRPLSHFATQAQNMSERFCKRHYMPEIKQVYVKAASTNHHDLLRKTHRE